MLLLGIHPFSHDTSAALIENGEIVFAIEEERLSRKKHSRDFPKKSITACLAYKGITIEDVDIICVSYDPVKQSKLRFLKFWLDYFPKANKRMLAEIKSFEFNFQLESMIRELLDFKKEIFFCHHHTAHMASAYYISEFDRSALFSVDGVGDIETSVVGLAEGNKIRVFDHLSINYPNSIGLLYTAITAYLGFIPHCDEGKVMGLASYGDPGRYRELYENIVSFDDHGCYTFNLDYLSYPFESGTDVSENFIKICGPPRKAKEPLQKRHMDIAAGLQDITEKAIFFTLNHLYEVTQCENLCMSGGVALNCVANGKISSHTPFRNFGFQAAACDSGSAAGAALYRYYNARETTKRVDTTSGEQVYLGTDFTNGYIGNILDKRGCYFSTPENVFEEVAELLKGGKIIAWFNGRMEFGPRALGNRSILTAPFPAEMKDILNSRVKHREGFRPFAPSVLYEDRNVYFDCRHDSPFMLFAFDVLKESIPYIPATVHVDNTARVHTVKKDDNPDYYNLIAHFKKKTGVGVILNTSFNVMGQPIVHTPEEALDTFLSTDIDVLVFNAHFVIKK